MAKVKAAPQIDAVAHILTDVEAETLMVKALVDTVADTRAEEKCETLFDTQ